MQSAGDNAILAFEQARVAHDFVVAWHRIVSSRNREKSVAQAQQHYRIGVATGDLVIWDDDLESACGIVITDAVRLESAGAPGQVLIDHVTYQALPLDLRYCYGPEEKIAGKRSEVFRVHRCQLEQPAKPA
jgi:class 3 adenylate cyclase